MDTRHSLETNLGALGLMEFPVGNRRMCPVCDGFNVSSAGSTPNAHTATCPVPALLARARALLKGNAFWPAKERRPVRERTASEQRYEAARAKPEGATAAQLITRGIKAAGGYPVAKGWHVVGYAHTVPKTTGSLVTMRKDYRIFVNVQRTGAHHLSGRVYSRLIAKGDTLDAALAKAITKVKKMQDLRREIRDEPFI